MNFKVLVKEAKSGKTYAQKSLFDSLAPKMLMVCRRYVKSHEDAEELMLDGFFNFFDRLDDFAYKSDPELFGWLKRIMINECLMFLRKKNLFIISTDQQPFEIPFREEVLDKLSASEIFELIVQLPPGYRTVFNLFAVEGMTHKEISSQLGITEGTSKSQLSKAKAMLQKLLSQNEINHEFRNSK